MPGNALYTSALHLGRVLLASLFILGGFNKIMNYEATALTMNDMGFPLIPLVLPATILLELGGGLAVAVGRSWAAISAFVLFGYTLVVNLVFHQFWGMQGEMAQLELSLFFKNISVAGGMLYLAAQTGSQSWKKQDNRLRPEG